MVRARNFGAEKHTVIDAHAGAQLKRPELICECTFLSREKQLSLTNTSHVKELNENFLVVILMERR